MRKLGQDKYISDNFKFSKQSIEHNVLDEHFFQEVLERNDGIKEALDSYKDEYQQFPELQQDLFSSLFRYRPKLKDTGEMDSDYVLNREVMNKIMDSHKYKELRPTTKTNEIHSTLGTQVLSEKSVDVIKDLMKEMPQEIQGLQDAQDKLQEAMQRQQQQQGQSGKEGSEDGDGEKVESDKFMSLKEAQKKLKEAKNKFNKKFQDKNMDNKFKKMMEKATEKVKETSNMIKDWGLESEPGFQKMDYQEQMKLIDKLRNSSKLKKIAKLAGRLKNVALKEQREKVKVGMDEVYDLEKGNRLRQVLSSELMKLNHHATKTLFKKDFVSHNLTQYKLRGKQKKAKGPIVMAIDESMSMAGEAEV